MYYPDQFDQRPLQISIFVGDLPGHEGPHVRRPFKMIHETAIVDDVAGVGGIAEYYSNQSKRFFLDGGLSIVFNGREYLGERYWSENLAFGDATPFFSDKPWRPWRLYSDVPGSVDLELCDGGILYSLRSGSDLVVSEVFPFREFVIEWSLLFDRILRIKKALGDIDATSDGGFAASANYLPPELLEIVGVDLLEYTDTAPLSDVFSNPRMLNL